MNTGTAIVIAGALIAGAIVVVNLRAPEQEPAAPAADVTQSDAPAPRPHGGGPDLASSGRDGQLERIEAELREARREIQRLTAEGGGDADEAPAAAMTPQEVAEKQERFFYLGKAYAAGKATKKEIAELLSMAQNRVLMERVVGSLEKQIAENPDDLVARMQLVEVQSARVHSAESITERSVLRDAVRDQLGQVLERDAENWDARYMQAVGISHSQRTPQGRAAAIREFESLITIQQDRPAEARYAKTYGQLAGVLLAEKDVAKAREVLQSGLRRHPDDKQLTEMLAKLPTGD